MKRSISRLRRPPARDPMGAVCTYYHWSNEKCQCSTGTAQLQSSARAVARARRPRRSAASPFAPPAASAGRASTITEPRRFRSPPARCRHRARADCHAVNRTAAPPRTPTTAGRRASVAWSASPWPTGGGPSSAWLSESEHGGLSDVRVRNQNWMLRRWRRPLVMVTSATTDLRTVESKPAGGRGGPACSTAWSGRRRLIARRRRCAVPAPRLRGGPRPRWPGARRAGRGWRRAR